MSKDNYVAYAAKSFTLPDICVRLRAVLDDPRSDASEIGKLISLDPSLTAKVLKLANSSLFRFPSQITSITKAISVVGGEALYNLVVAETANTAFSHFDSALINIDKHWYASVYTGMVAKYLAKTLNIRGSERFFVMGILQNLSELVVAKVSPERYTEYRNADYAGLPYDQQNAFFGFTFSQCSGTILDRWNIPLALHYPITYLSDVKKQTGKSDIAILAMAMRIAIAQEDEKHENEIELFPSELANTLNIDFDTIDNAVEYANRETSKVSMLIR